MSVKTIVAGILIAFFIIVVIGVLALVALSYMSESVEKERVKVKFTQYDGNDPGSFCRDYPTDVQCMG